LSRMGGEGGYGQRDIDSAAVLCDAHRLVMIDAPAPLQPRQYLMLFPLQLRWNDPKDRLTDHLARLIAENPRRADIPRGDAPFESFADDRVVGGKNDGC